MLQVFCLIHRIGKRANSVNKESSSNRPSIGGSTVHNLSRKRLDPGEQNVLFVRSKLLGNLKRKQMCCVREALSIGGSGLPPIHKNVLRLALGESFSTNSHTASGHFSSGREEPVIEQRLWVATCFSCTSESERQQAQPMRRKQRGQQQRCLFKKLRSQADLFCFQTCVIAPIFGLALARVKSTMLLKVVEKAGFSEYGSSVPQYAVGRFVGHDGGPVPLVRKTGTETHQCVAPLMFFSCVCRQREVLLDCWF